MDNIIYDPVPLPFKTFPDFNDTEFKYSFDYDTNGICYFLATKYGQRSRWENPALSGRIVLTSTAWNKIYDMVGRVSTYSRSQNTPNAWVVINFGANIRIKPTCYTIRQNLFNGYFIKKWNLLGSLDGVSWKIICEHSYRISPFNTPKQ